MLYERMLKEKKRIEKEIKMLKRKLEKCPKENLICCKNGKYYKWYSSDGHTKTYIPKADHLFAEKLAVKKYWTLHLKSMLQEQKAIDFYLKHHSEKAYQEEQALLNSSEFQKLISKLYQPKSQELLEWMNSTYETNSKFPEQLVHRTRAGIYVRSKSELLITMILCKHQIPFRYECALQLGSIKLYPDFTIRHPVTGQIFYWEHFGLMDDPSYRNKTNSKMQLYISNGIIPSIQLITTYETKEYPLSEEMVEEIIKYYFL